MMKEYKGFWFECESKEAEDGLIEYIDSLGTSPDELPSVGEENYANWHCDYDFDGVKMLVLPENIKRIGKCVFAQSKIQNLVADGVEIIDELAFYNTRHLESVSAKNCKALVSIDPESGEPTEFADCFNHSCVKQLNLPNVEFVGRYCFYDMPNIEVLHLPKVKTMYSHAVYGNENLKVLDIHSLQDAPVSVVTMNPKLEEIDVSGLRSASSLAFYGNGIELNFGLKPEVVKSEEKLLKEDEIKLQQKETFEYEFCYNGFYFNLVEGLSDEEKLETLLKLKREIDVWNETGKISASENMHLNESGHECFKNVKDIYVSEKINAIGNYAFAKMYALESVVAPSVLSVGEHSFYYDGLLRYVDLGNCKVLCADAFNGAAFEYAESETNAKIFIPNVEIAKKHAFWQTGFVLVNMPKCENLEISAFEENSALKKVIVGNAGEFVFVENPVLSEVVESGNFAKLKE